MAYPTAVYNWNPFKQGTDWSRSVTFKTNGVEDTLTGWTAKFTVRDEDNTGGALILDISTTVNANGSIITITGGVVTITLSDVDTDLLIFNTYYYDLKLISTAGTGSKEDTPLTGTLTILRNVAA